MKSQRAKLHSTEGVNYDISDGWKFMETIARYFYVAIFFSLFLSLFFFFSSFNLSQPKKMVSEELKIFLNGFLIGSGTASSIVETRVHHVDAR